MLKLVASMSKKNIYCLFKKKNEIALQNEFIFLLFKSISHVLKTPCYGSNVTYQKFELTFSSLRSILIQLSVSTAVGQIYYFARRSRQFSAFDCSNLESHHQQNAICWVLSTLFHFISYSIINMATNYLLWPQPHSGMKKEI